LLGALCPRHGERHVKIFGYELWLDLSDQIQREMYLGVFEPQETRFVRARIRSGMTFVDVGANVGYFTLLASSIVGPMGRVLAFEPSPYACGRLRRSIEENAVTNVTLLQTAVGKAAGELPLYLPAKHGLHSPTMVAHAGSGVPVSVQVVRLDDVLKGLEVDHVDMLKVDVEGFEPDVLQGAERLLEQGAIGSALVEFNRVWLTEHGSSAEELYDQLARHGLKSDVRPDPKVIVQNLCFSLVR
jgi:FkbM family methyltransferase